MDHRPTRREFLSSAATAPVLLALPAPAESDQVPDWDEPAFRRLVDALGEGLRIDNWLTYDFPHAPVLDGQWESTPYDPRLAHRHCSPVYKLRLDELERAKNLAWWQIYTLATEVRRLLSLPPTFTDWQFNPYRDDAPTTRFVSVPVMTARPRPDGMADVFFWVEIWDCVDTRDACVLVPFSPGKPTIYRRF